jgi:hypothetical protein
MHAVMVRVKINDVEGGQQMLESEVVPGVKQIPGFVAGWWTRSLDGSNGASLVIFESEEAAQGMKQRLEGPEGPISSDAVDLESVEVREVAAHA